MTNQDPHTRLAKANAARKLKTLTTTLPILKTGKIMAVQESGSVNVWSEGTLITDATCSTAYSNRKPGDMVQLLLDGTRTVVLCQVGQDPTYAAPQYSWNSRQVYTSWGQASTGNWQQSCSNTGADTDPRFVAWSYYDGANNLLVQRAGSASGIKLYLARDANETYGTVDNVATIIQPHGYDALPATGFVPVNGFAPMTVALGVGAYAYLTLPPAWFSAVQAGTIRGFTTQIQDLRPGVNYAVFSDTAASYTMV